MRLFEKPRDVQKPSPELVQKANQEQAQTQKMLPGIAERVPKQEKTAEEAAKKKFIRQLVNRKLVPVLSTAARKPTTDEIMHLHDNIRIFKQEASLGELVKGQPLLKKLGYYFGRYLLGDPDESATQGTHYKGTIRISRGSRPYASFIRTAAHESTHYLKFKDEPSGDEPQKPAGTKFSLNKLVFGEEFAPAPSLVSMAVKEFYAQGTTLFTSFGNGRPSGLKRTSRSFSSHTNLVESRRAFRLDPLFRYQENELVLGKMFDPSPHALSRAYLLKLIHQGKITKPSQVYRMPREEVEAGLEQMKKEASQIYSTRFRNYIYRLPRSSLENLRKHLSKPTTQVK